MDNHGVVDRFLAVCAETRMVIPSYPGWKMVRGEMETQPRLSTKIGSREDERWILNDLKGYLTVFLKKDEQIWLSGVVYWKHRWLPANDQVLVCHEDVELLLDANNNDRIFHNDQKTAGLLNHISRAIVSFYDRQMSAGNLIPQRKPVASSSVVGW